MNDKWDILGIGITAVDDFFYVNGFPPPDARREIIRAERRCGGLTAAALVTAARLGARCAYAGMLGDDELSNIILDDFRRHGIDTAPCLIRPGVRPYHSTIIVDALTGSRNIFYTKHGVACRPAETLSEEIISSAGLLYLDQLHVPAMIQAARWARAHQRPTVADFDHFNHPDMPALLELTGHLIVSHELALPATGAESVEQAALILARVPRSVTVVTHGDRGGCYVLGSTPDRVLRYGAFKVKVVNTTGCGDVFHGAYAAALILRLPLEQALNFASAAAALKAAGVHHPDANAVRQFLAHPCENPLP